MASSLLPSAAALEVYLRAAALSDVDAFVRALPGPFVLVRLDERGGADEPAPWAWHVLMKEHVDDAAADDDVFISALLGDAAASSDEATATGPAQPPLPLPKAEEAASVVVVPDGGGRVGRGKGCALRIAERSVSRAHAMLQVDGDSCAVVDLDSDNGTSINGMVLAPGTTQSLRSGDVLALGDVVFLLLDRRGFFTHLPALGGG